MPFYWSHPESSSYGVVETLEELEELQREDPCVEEVSKEQYDKLVAESGESPNKP